MLSADNVIQINDVNSVSRSCRVGRVVIVCGRCEALALCNPSESNEDTD